MPAPATLLANISLSAPTHMHIFRRVPLLSLTWPLPPPSSHSPPRQAAATPHLVASTYRLAATTLRLAAATPYLDATTPHLADGASYLAAAKFTFVTYALSASCPSLRPLLSRY